MANELCNLQDRRELEYLRSLKEKGIDGTRMLKDIGGYNPETGGFRVGNIRLDKFDIPEEVQNFMGQVINEGHYYVEQRRGTINWEKNQQLAKEIRTRIKLRKGETLNSEELENLSNAVAGLSIKAAEASRIAEKNGAAEIDVAKARIAREEFNLALASLSGVKSEAGRALSIQRKLMSAIDARDMRLMREALKRADGKYTSEEIASLLSKFAPDDFFGQYRFLQNLYKPKFGDYVMELWYNSILSGPITHLRNFVGNVSHDLFIAATHPIAVLYDVTYAKRKGVERSIYMGELPGMFKSGLQGFIPGLQKAMHILSQGFSFDDAAKLEFRKPEAFRGKITQYLNTPRRLLGASDSIARSMIMSAEIYGRAYTMAKNEGVKGDAMAARIAEIIANPTPEILKGASEFAARSVFQQDGGKFLQAMSRLRSSVEVAGMQPVAFIIPFVETPANIMRVGFRATPIGFMRKAVTQRERARDFGSAMLGSLILATLAVYAAAGNISGSGPSDKEKKSALYRIGWQPNSIRIGGKWYSYKNISPLNVLLNGVGNAMDAYIYDGMIPDSNGLATWMVGYGKSLLDQSFFSGVNGLLSAITGSEKEQTNFLNRYATGFIPQAVQQTVRIVDPTYYMTTSMTDAFKNALGIRSELPIKYDVFGNPIKGQRAAGLPFFPSTENISPLEKKLIELGVEAITPPPNKIGKRAMTDREYSEFSQKVGKLLVERLSDESLLPSDASSMEAQDAIDDIRKDIYKEVRDEMFPDLSGQELVLRYEDDSAQNPNGIIDNLMVYAKAAGTDPITAFQRMFSGQRIIRIDHNTVIVARPSVDWSQNMKKQMGYQEGDELILDHTIPIALGGDGKSRSNLKLVPKDIWEEYTPVEVHLINLLKDEKIEKKKAWQLITDFKERKIEADEILSIK